MEDISKNGRIQMTIIDNHLMELYNAGVQEERGRLLNLIREMIQEKDVRSDHVAVSVLDWALKRILRSE